MKQTLFASIEFKFFTKRKRKRGFLEDINPVVSFTVKLP
jgi:hypothetical protein